MRTNMYLHILLCMNHSWSKLFSTTDDLDVNHKQKQAPSFVPL